MRSNHDSEPTLTRRTLMLGAAASLVPLGAPTALAQSSSNTTPTPTPAPGAAQLGPALVLNSRDATVSVIDPISYKLLRVVQVGKEPHHLYPTPDNQSVIVANAIGNDLCVLNPMTGEVKRWIKKIDDPYHLLFSPDQRWFAVACNRLDRVDLYRYEAGEFNLEKRFQLGKTPSHLTMSSDSRSLYVSLQESDELAQIDLVSQKVVAKIPSTGRQPAGIQISPDDKLLFAGIMGSDHVQVVDAKDMKTLGKIVTNRGAHATRPHGDRRHLWVSNRVANTISMIDMLTQKVVTEIAVPNGPDCMEVTADGKQLWLTARWDRQLVVVDLVQRKVSATIPVGRSPHGVYLHQRAGLV